MLKRFSKNLSLLQNLSTLIGKTPLLEIEFKYKKIFGRIYAKFENYNMTGSIKDRMIFQIILSGYNNKILKPESTLVEATSGNTGISLAAIGGFLGHNVKIFMPKWMSKERKQLIESFGATICLISKEEGGFIEAINKTEKLAKTNSNVFLPKQFSNNENIIAHYQTTGPEIWRQMLKKGLTTNAFVAGVGTGGTIMGVGKFLKEKNKTITIHPLEPSNSPILSTGIKNVSGHKIQGVSDDFIPPIVDLNVLDKIVSVDDCDSIIMAQKLAKDLGLGVGISSGANFLGAIIVQNKLPNSTNNVVTIFSDDNKKYLSTELSKKQEMKEHFLSKDIELIGFDVIK
jgi:cysteine synthase